MINIDNVLKNNEEILLLVATSACFVGLSALLFSCLFIVQR